MKADPDRDNKILSADSEDNDSAVSQDSETANAFDISFNKKSEDFKIVKRSINEDSGEQSKTISSGKEQESLFAQ